jgi:hypothetical protein
LEPSLKTGAESNSELRGLIPLVQRGNSRFTFPNGELLFNEDTQILSFGGLVSISALLFCVFLFFLAEPFFPASHESFLNFEIGILLLHIVFFL